MTDRDAKWPLTQHATFNINTSKKYRAQTRILQHELNRKNAALDIKTQKKHAALVVDGIWGPKTTAAVLRWQYKAGHPKPTGRLDRPQWEIVVNEAMPNKNWLARAEARAKKHTPKPPAKVFKPAILSPSQWGSRGTAYGYKGIKTTFKGKISIPHYGAIGNRKGPTTRSAEIALVRAFESHHLYSNGWSGGLGYHFAIGQSGTIYTSARGQNMWTGAHTGNARGKRIAGGHSANSCMGVVFLVGDNEKASAAAIRSYEWLEKHYGTKKRERHSFFDYTSCCGEVLARQLGLRYGG